MDYAIAAEQPDRADVIELVSTHLEFARSSSSLCSVHAMDAEALTDPSVTFFTCRSTGEERLLLGIGALKTLDAAHGEIKSMHTAAAARGFGVAWAMVNHIADSAQERGMSRLSLETGTMEAFAPARALYVSAGFVVCPPFGEYQQDDESVCMSREIPPPIVTPLNLHATTEAETGGAIGEEPTAPEL